jgi:polyphenol oxidase
MIDANTGLRGSEEAASDGWNTRRQFLINAGVSAGGVGLLSHASPRQGLAQVVDPGPTDCAPPFPTKPAVKFVPNASQPVRVRMSAFDLPTTRAQQLNDAYQKLRDLSSSDPNNPIGWMQQANMHCYYCGGPQADQLPEIHDGWWFFPWHRCYLFFHERILASVVKDPTLALAYWDWENPSRRTVPPPFANLPALNDQCRGSSTSTTMPDWFFDGKPDPSNPQIQVESFVDVMNTRSTKVFMGSEPSPDPLTGGVGGALENGQHGIIHIWNGQPSLADLNGVPDMGVLATAARDPIFFAHHANIDRLWGIWLGKAGHKPPHSSSWLNQPFFFYDENGVWTSITVKDVIEQERNLRYSYTDATTGTTSVAMPVMASGHGQASKNTLTPDPVTEKLTIPTAPTPAAPAAAAEANAAPPVYILHIDDVVVPIDQGAIVRVFVNKPDANASTPSDDPHAVGYFTVVPRVVRAKGPAMAGHPTHSHRPKNVILDVTRKIGPLLQPGGKLEVTLVPMGGADKKPASVNLTYGKVYLTVE